MTHHINRTDVAPDGTVRTIVDRAVLSLTTGYAVATIRKHCPVLQYDEATGRAVYDRDASLALLQASGVEPRPQTRGPRTGPVRARRRSNA